MPSKWRSEWLDWQPPQASFVSFGSSLQGENPIIQPLQDDSRGQIIEKTGRDVPTKPTKPPLMPRGVTLIRWEPKPAPVIISRLAVVNDVAEYVRTTLAELASALHQQHDTPEYTARSNGAINALVQPGAMAVRECIDRLQQCGVIVQVPGIGSPSGGK